MQSFGILIYKASRDTTLKHKTRSVKQIRKKPAFHQLLSPPHTRVWGWSELALFFLRHSQTLPCSALLFCVEICYLDSYPHVTQGIQFCTCSYPVTFSVHLFIHFHVSYDITKCKLLPWQPTVRNAERNRGNPCMHGSMLRFTITMFCSNLQMPITQQDPPP